MYNWNLLLNEELFHNIHYQMKEYHLHLHIPLRIHLDYAYILLNLEVQRIVNSVEHFYGFHVHSAPPSLYRSFCWARSIPLPHHNLIFYFPASSLPRMTVFPVS